ncbi:MAG: sulfite exporter TauE/SafE family protein [Actinomycetota bacterium]
MAVSVEFAVVVVAAGVLVGVLSALFGVGGGLLMVPFMVLVLSEDQHVAEGTSLLVIVPTAVAGVLAHARNRFVSFRHAAPLALGGIGGVYVGATIALRTKPEQLQLIFGIFLAVMGLKNVVDAVRQLMDRRRTRR